MRHGAGAIGQHVVEPARHRDLVAPADAALPAVLLQIVGGGEDQVGRVVDHVAAAVAVAVDRVALERGRHELGRAERAGPGAAHLLGAQIAAIEDFQRGQELVAEIGLPAADAGQRRGGIQHVAIAHLGRVVGFDAPDRRDDVAVDPERFFGGVELRLVLRQDLAALGEPVVVHQDVEIVPDRLGEFRLRIHQVHDPQIGRESAVKRRKLWLRDAAARGLRPQRGDASVEIRRRLADRRAPSSADGRRRRPRRSRAARPTIPTALVPAPGAARVGLGRAQSSR